jgi:colicin import membrane protein
MARTLKTYQTSLGFFDLAIAAPSMKKAAEAWGLKTKEFKRGFAKETHDPAIVAATMSKPGVVLRRPVGSNGPFSEHAELPKDLPIGKVKEEPAKPRPKLKEPVRKVDNKAIRDAALAFEKERRRRENTRRREETAREKERKRRDQLIAKAEKVFEAAKREHEITAKKIETDRAALDKRSHAESARWEKQREKLEAALRRARD